MDISIAQNLEITTLHTWEDFVKRFGFDLALQSAIPYHETIFYTDFQYDLIKRLQEDYQVVMIKGLRNEMDFSYEKKNHLLNEMIGVKEELGVETVFLFSEPEYEAYSSSDIKFLLASSKAEVGYNMLHNPPKLMKNDN